MKLKSEAVKEIKKIENVKKLENMKRSLIVAKSVNKKPSKTCMSVKIGKQHVTHLFHIYCKNPCDQ